MVRYAELTDQSVVRYIGEAPALPVMTGVTIIDITGIECSVGWIYDALTGNLSAPTSPTTSTTDTGFMLTSSNAVISGFSMPSLPGGWSMTFTGGVAVINNVQVTIPAATVTFTSMTDHVIVIAGMNRIIARPLLSKPIASSGELVLFQVYIATAVNPSAPYAIADRRTFVDTGIRGALPLLDMVKAAQISGGTYDGAFRTNRVGDINWYFANLGLWPFCEAIPAEVQAHLDRQITLFYGASGTGATDWTTLHGTAHSGYSKWPYDVVSTGKSTPTNFYSGTVAKERADSHDSYAATFLRLAVRYATTASGGLTWWDTNYTAIKDCLYYNILLRQVPTPTASPAGYLTSTFQDTAVYPFALTMDNIEVWKAVKETLALMTSRGGTQATDAASYASYETNLLAGLQALWTSTANAAGDTEWMALGWDINADARLANQHNLWYPNLVVYPMLEAYQVPLNADADLNRQRLSRGLELIAAKAPAWWLTRNYDALPWIQNLVGMARAGALDVAMTGLSFVQRHHGRTFDGLLIHEMGWLRLTQRLLGGEDL